MVIGDENVVNTSFTELFEALDELKKQVSQAKKLSDEQKLILASDIDSINNQIAKPEPDKQIVARLWASAEKHVYKRRAFLPMQQPRNGRGKDLRLIKGKH